jgi:hypothetical protein
MPLSRLDLRRGPDIIEKPFTGREESLMAKALFVALLFVVAANQALAQYPRYVPPAGRTLPNELNYFRRDVGLLDQYNGFVNPVRQLDSQLRMMQNQQRADFQANQRAISQVRAAQAAPTGVGGTFMNYSHYYPSQPGQRR